jgi:hypothetical protein
MFSGERGLPVRLIAVWLAVLVVCSSAQSASGEVKPGDFVNAKNAARVKEVLPPGVYWRVLHGMTIKIVPTERIDWPPPYREATEKYSAQVRLTPDHRSLVGYVAGQPFPLIDANDPYAAVKVMWNNAFRPMYSDDLDARFFGCHGRYEEREKKEHEVEYEEIGHYRIYNEVGRTEVEPLPTDLDFKTTGRYFLAALYPVLAPAEIRGRGFLRYRYADPNRGDDAWFWRPGARRLRRVSEDFLGSSEGVEQFYPDDYEGFSAKNENYDWRFLGERTMLGAVDVEHVPAVPCETDGRASVCPERWQVRRVYIVEGVPRRSRVPEELYSKHIVYVDAEAWAVLAHDAYDRRGELFKSFANWLTYRDRPVPDAKIAIYPFKRLFEVAETTTDVQSGLAETCFLPSPDTKERETWYINMGASDRGMFTLQAMIDAAH